MRILVYGLNFTPEQVGIGKFTGEMVTWLAARGHEVRVVTAPPYYPQWIVFDGFRTGWYESSVDNGIRVDRCPLWVPRKPSGLKRILHLASFSISSSPMLLRHLFWKPEVVFCVEPSFMTLPSGVLYARCTGAKCWLHVQDFEIDAAFDLGIVRSKFLKSIVGRIERQVMSWFDCVSSISDRMVERLRKKGFAESRTTLFPNWVDCDAIYPMNTMSEIRKSLGVSGGKVVFQYSGSMGEKQGLEIIVEAARRLQARQDLVFVMSGTGGAAARLAASTSALNNVLWIPLQPFEKLNDLLNMADVHLLPQRGDAADLVLPSKLTGMMASGRPIITTAIPGTQLATAVSDCGLVVAPEDPTAFVEAISQLADDATLRKRMGAQARLYAETHLRCDIIMKQFENELFQLCGQAMSVVP